MPADIPLPVQLVLNEYIGLINDALPDVLVGVYLHGSLALGAFELGLSDIDFITITSRRCSTADIDTLRAIHQWLSQQYPDIPLEGSYLQWRDVGQLQATMLPHPYIHDGILHSSGYHDINGVTWWILKYRGIAVIGPPPEQFDIQVDWDDLVAKMHDNLNTYWARFTTNPRRVAWLMTDYGIQWAVLGVLRQFYTFREHAITSKTGAGLYALRHTPEQWHGLIHEAIAIRTGSGGWPHRFRIVRALSARAFVQLIIAACKTGTAGSRSQAE